MGLILDISHHQNPEKINYDKIAKQVDFVIIRTQYGSNLIDRHYKTHHQHFQKRGVPTAAYAWVRGVGITDMEKEATDFYERTKAFAPIFWFVDVEEKSMSNIRKGISAYIKQLRSLGAEKVGIYVGHHLYKDFNLDMSEADAIWIPHYGKNDGTVNSKPAYVCDLHQYTDKGRLEGYHGYLDLNRIVSDKKLNFFTGVALAKPERPTKSKPPVKAVHVKRVDTELKGNRVENIYSGPVRFYDGPRWTNPTGTFQPGEGWIIDDKYMVDGSPMYRVKNSKGALYYITANSKYVAVKKAGASVTVKKQYHTVKRGDTVSQLAIDYQTTTAKIKQLNKLKDVNKIYVGEKLRVR